MNSINNTISGLASSLLLNVGLTGIAEKLDPTQRQSMENSGEATAAEPCIYICAFTPEVGQ